MFKEELKSLTSRIPGAKGALVMGLDGIPVDKWVVPDGPQLEALSAEYLSLLKKSRDTDQELGGGRTEELSIFTDRLVLLLRAVTPEYFLVFALGTRSSVGRARYELSKSVMRLAKEFA